MSVGGKGPLPPASLSYFTGGPNLSIFGGLDEKWTLGT
jgi:hypothetical protein